MLAEENHILPAVIIGLILIKHQLLKVKKIVCIETNEIFDSIRNAAKWAGVSERCVGRACSGQYKTAGGYHA